MTSKSFYVNDNYINTTIYDDSIVIPTEPILPKRLTILQPIFSSKGKSNKIMDFSSSSIVKSIYGKDMEDLNRFGQGGINIIHAMGAGASAQICRLLPDNAETATLLSKLIVKERTDIPVYQRSTDGGFELDTGGNKIPVTIPNPAYVPEGAEPETIPKVVAGLEIKVVIDACDPTAATVGKITVTTVGELSTYSIPLYRLVYNGPGKCGNSIGHAIINDFERDDSVNDGRRYIMTLFEKDSKGNTNTYGEPFYFSLNPEAVLVEGTEVFENLKYVFTKKDTSGNERAVLCDPFIMDNYSVLSEVIAKYSGTVDPNDIDVLNCLDKNGNPYDNFILSEEVDHSDYIDAVYYLRGGSDGSLQLGYTYTNDEDQTVTVDAEEVEATKRALLVNFFHGRIDPALFDERMIFSDIVFDADYDFESVKPAMLGKFRDIRPDIMVIADIGKTARNCPQAINLVKSIYGMVDGSAAYTAAVIVHAGTTLDRALPLHLTATYDYSYGLAKCYGAAGTFSVFAGFQLAKVETMEFDWYPYKDEYDTMIGPLKKLGCVFAFVINREGVAAYMSESNMYVHKNSKLKSIRNGMVIGDAVRMCKSILIKYVYDNEGSAGAIRKATDEINQTVVGRYPANIAVIPSLYQTTRDKQMESTTCDISYKFPGMTQDWKLNIYAKRQDV